MQQHEYFMQQALNYAKQGRGRTGENPCVGCVIMRGEQIISYGRTADGGRPHAEVIALQLLPFVSDDMVIYVTLEPCAHYGKTPPCAQAIIDAGIKQVVIACGDADARVSGAGIAKLKQAGVEVIFGVLEADAKLHHRGFLRRIQQGLPEIMVKIATSYDEKITSSDGWITGELSRNYGQLLRANYDAILTGIGTVKADNPMLNCRLSGLEQYSPLRVVLDKHLITDLNSNIVQTAHQIPTLILSTNHDTAKIARLAALNVEVELLNNDFSFTDAIMHLSTRGINSVMVEGGQRITEAALNSRRADDLYWFIAKDKILGKSQLPALQSGSLHNYFHNAKLQQQLTFVNDIMLHYSLNCH
jgi:diaminohydroxyphosphoribosylaminopyrimidine deaminase/5-amino-6-(5-phosphoribosylamino)uracil reductase